MAIPIKTPGEIAAMRSSGRLAWSIIEEVAKGCRVGVTSRELDALARQCIARAGAEPLLLGYTSADNVPFPGASCICINEEVVHAVPSDRIVREGDVVTIDVAVRDTAGWCADAATSLIVGANPRADRLVQLGKHVLNAAIAAASPGVRWSQVATAAKQAVGDGFTLVPGYCGHGIGRSMHEHPRACFGSVKPADDFRLLPGMVITLEPIVVEGNPELVTLDDGWTVVTANRAWAVHEERTIAITRTGAQLLTA